MDENGAIEFLRYGFLLVFSNNCRTTMQRPTNNITTVVLKEKGKCIYIAHIFVVHTRRSGMDHTVLPAITPVLAFTS